ncbi:sulfite exporter TauE/SafE family protein [Pseudalkalibacillus berkeleyi]|uniref:Probable membrane transporter protein n=1 Tax=Pseudalkalibacillus berkeleyi TaxID=1069813 RepID=A0ABS9H187_9BACL|nr:sulfite exporter TauE/SafE family protein [Pseudalkalibacillus berkeleyi]MCF6138714.1 sulfite exporter TauE/SafE family protein [Pseudalkalibacillus berkeleyi]
MELLFILLGFAVGILSGYFGIGGGFILTPVLMLMGFAPVVAITTSLMYAIGSSLSGVWAHYKMNNVIWKTALILGVSGVAATQLAKPFVLWLDRNGFDETIIPIIYAVIIGYFAYSLLKKTNKKKVSQKGNPGIIKIVIIGFIGGLMSATLGVGGGFVMVPLMISLMGFEPRKAVGTSLVSVMMIVTAGFISYSVSIDIDYVLGLLLIAGALFGSQLGAKLTSLYTDTQIKKYFGLLYITTLVGILFELFNFDIAGMIVLALYVVLLLGKFIVDFIQRKQNPSILKHQDQ